MESVTSRLVYPSLVASAGLVVYTYQMIQVGRARQRYGVEAPKTTGPEEFDRIFRVHQNTMEQLVTFIPSLYASALFWDPRIVSGIGSLFVIGRFAYGLGYYQKAEYRSYGMLATMLSQTTLLLGAIVGAIKYLRK